MNILFIYIKNVFSFIIYSVLLDMKSKCTLFFFNTNTIVTPIVGGGGNISMRNLRFKNL